jgi:hypothetical protein
MKARLTLALLAAVATAAGGCDSDSLLQAKRIESQNELIGGPSAKSKLGDFKIENDQLRATIGGPGPGWAAGVFGGTLLDVDRHRWQSAHQAGHGFDAFAESFPLANLLIPNPADPKKVLKLTAEDVQVVTEGTDAPTVSVVKDGSDGKEAMIRVRGHAGYLFDVLKFLNRPFLDETIKGLSFGGFSSDQIIDLLAGLLNVNLFALLNRLQINFDFTTDYVLHPGESYLTITTTLQLAPPAQALLNGCAPVACDKDCPDGYVMREVEEAPPDGRSTPFLRMCPLCECAKPVAQMPTFNESRDFFQVLLGTPEVWPDPQWKAGVVVGDFLFYGGNTSVFGPGFGFDIQRKIYEDMWEGVGTLGSPFAVDWLAGIADNVSYAWVTRNPNERSGFDCPGYRIVVTRLDPAFEDAVAQALQDGWQTPDGKPVISKGDAAARARQAVVDRKPIQLPVPEIPVPAPEGRPAFDAWLAATLAGPEVAAARAKLGDGVTMGLLPRHDCMPSKLLVPLFSTSATAVLTNFTEGDRLAKTVDGVLRDENRSYTFTRYLAVGDGDVGSVLRTVYDLRGTDRGDVAGIVVEEGSMRPLTHVQVFVLQDWRADDTEAAPATYADYRPLALDRLGNTGFVSQMQTDLGLDTQLDGDFSGPLPPGRYFALAHDKDRGSSALVPFTVVAGRTTTVNLALPPVATVDYRIDDEGGAASPARLSFIPVDATGLRFDWDGANAPEMNDPRYDHGILKHELSITGRGTVALPPGTYDVVASRGIEFGVAELKGYKAVAGQRKALHVLLPREVDTSGYVSADLHVHSGNSVDAGLKLDLRVKASVVEGIEFFTSSDHDILTDYLPLVMKMGVDRFIKTEVGTETSPLEYGHYNGFPMRYDDTKWSVHDPAPWQGRTMTETWQEMRDRSSAGPDGFVLQVNHPRDGFMGYFAQIGMKGYSLERKTPGMEMCNKVLEESPCTFDVFELMNGKNFQYLHTPTVGEAHAHNTCYKEIVKARDPAKLPVRNDDYGAAVCGWLQKDPIADCPKAIEDAKGLDGLSEDEVAARVIARDHCNWHKAFREAVADACPLGATLLDCKRGALEALKMLSVRYQMERTPEENDAFYATTAATDVGCDYAKAMTGCAADPKAAAGCGGADCACEACVCADLPECCKTAAAGGTGWTQACADACRGGCHGCENRPCTDRFEPIEDWFAFLDVGFDKAAVGNSDSHSLVNEIGLPRNFVASPTDSVAGIDADQVNRAAKAGRVVVSSGPMIDFRIVTDQGSAGIAETVQSGGGKVAARLRVQTASWFKVDRIEVWSNSRLVKRLFPDRPKEDLIDFEGEIDLGTPAQDAWYVVLAYGLNDPDQLSPVYKRHPYGDMLISTLISLGAQQLLASFGSLLDMLPPGILDIESLLGSLELPDSFPVFPWAATNPIRVDVDGDGFVPAKAKAGADGKWILPSFCAQPCVPAPGADGKPGRSTCGENQACVPSEKDATVGTCRVPIPETCVGIQPIAKQ